MFRQYSELKNPECMEMSVRFAYVAEINEWDNRAHLERIRRYATILTRGLTLSHTRLEQITIACILHDVGKIMTPDHLLKKQGQFDPIDRQTMEHHTIDGAVILRDSQSPVLQLGASIARSHHERWDGSGYPDRLKEEEIPLPARICAIADVFDALTTDRVYKKHIEIDDSYQLIIENSGIFFDPSLVEVFKRHFEEFRKINSSYS